MTNAQVIELHEAGLSDEVIITKIKTTLGNYDTSIEGLKHLKNAGIPQNIITELIKKSANPKEPTTTAEILAAHRAEREQAREERRKKIEAAQAKREMQSEISEEKHQKDIKKQLKLMEQNKPENQLIHIYSDENSIGNKMLGIKLNGQKLAIMGDENESPFTSHWLEFYNQFYIKKSNPPTHKCTVLGTESGLRIYLHEITTDRNKWPITICVNESGQRKWSIIYNNNCTLGLADVVNSGGTIQAIRWEDQRAKMDEFIKNL